MKPSAFVILAALIVIFIEEAEGAPAHQLNATTTAEPYLKDDLLQENSDNVHHGRQHSTSNLAWLVTPALFLLGVLYVIYKCCRDGLCNCKKLRRRAAAMGESSGGSPDHGYVPLSQIAMYSGAQIPITHRSIVGGQPVGSSEGSSGSTRRLLLVHNRTYCVTVDTVPGAGGLPSRRILVQPLKPPSYDEVLAQQAQLGGDADATGALPAYPPQYTSSDPPCYSIAMGEITPTPPLEDHLALESVITAIEQSEHNDLPTVFVSNRRRHRSAQDALVRRGERHRHLSAQERRLWSRTEDGYPGDFRPRCFSFSALKDAFRRSSVDVQERESLLAGDERDETVFASRDNLDATLSNAAMAASAIPLNSSERTIRRPFKAAKRPSHQVSFEVKILEDSGESSESLNEVMQNNSNAIGAQLRQRHSSAPETAKQQNSKSRHLSGNT